MVPTELEIEGDLLTTPPTPMSHRGLNAYLGILTKPPHLLFPPSLSPHDAVDGLPGQLYGVMNCVGAKCNTGIPQSRMANALRGMPATVLHLLLYSTFPGFM